MRVLFDGLVPVAYGQVYVSTRDLTDMEAAFAGQVNGLCGAVVPGELFLMTASSDGKVRITIELHESEPPAAAEEWQEVVEVPFRLRAATVDLVPWGASSLARLALAPDGQVLPAFRVRYCALGMDEGRNPYGSFDPDDITEDDYTYMEQRPDRYLLAFWPAEGRPERIVRQTSNAAAYWHDWASALPAPPALGELVEAESRLQEERLRRSEEERRARELRMWGGLLPAGRLRSVGGSARDLALMDRSLVDGIAGADDATQRQIAIWAARTALAAAGIADVDWLAPAWGALERGEPLPAPFIDTTAILTRLASEPSFPAAARVWFMQGTTGPALEAAGHSVLPMMLGLTSLWAAADPDPLRAALDALYAALTTQGPMHDAFFAEVRRVFPSVAR